LGGQARQVRQLLLGHEALRQPRIETVESQKYDLPHARVPVTFAAAGGAPGHAKRPQQQREDAQEEAGYQGQKRTEERKSRAGADIGELRGVRMEVAVGQRHQCERKLSCGARTRACRVPMIANRSAPPGPIVPRLIYKDVAKAIDWLRGAFGFTERLRTSPEPDGTIHHAQLAIGEGSVILTGQPVARPNEFIQALMVHVDNVDEHFARAKQFGARILSPPDSKPFGERQYAAEDLEGHRWAFSESVADVQPEAWGATVSEIEDRITRLPRPRLCYLQIPAVDAHQSAAFYERVFG